MDRRDVFGKLRRGAVGVGDHLKDAKDTRETSQRLPRSQKRVVLRAGDLNERCEPRNLHKSSQILTNIDKSGKK